MKIKISSHNKISRIDFCLLGMPVRIQFSNYGVIEYVYSADGRRLKIIHRTAVPQSTNLSVGQTHTLTAAETHSVDSTEYIGDFQYENGSFKQYSFGDGYITGMGGMSQYKYFIKDHLGNNRIVADNQGNVLQTTHYYPYGGFLSQSTNQEYQKYKYNGKELDLMHGLNEYDYGARQLDPAICQFTSMDPLCEKYYHVSPYAYCGGNPVNRVDPDGKDWYKVRATGQYVYDKSLNSSNFTTKYGWKNYMYIGKNAETPNGRYLSLFGENMDASSSHAQLYKHIENAFVNYENVRNGKGAYESEDFNIGKKYKEDLYANNYNVYPMEYEGAKVRYTVLRSDKKTNNMIGYVETFMKKVDEKNNLPSGVIIAIKPVRQGSEGSTIVRITFEDIIKAQAFLDKYNQEFGTNIRITKYENSYK